jgi:aryl-alcohol dehydrogenase-like predicted oxidoreductase
MRYNLLGTTGLFVSELALGTMTFGASGPFKVMGTVEQADADAMVHHALEAGVNLIDTADAYSNGNAERVLGQSLKNVGGSRNSVLVATKAFDSMGDGPNQGGLSRSHLLDAATASLARLGTDYIDLFQLHGFDAATPIEESLEALTLLQRQGRVRYVGVSNWAAWQIAKALGTSALRDLAKFASVQAYYSIAGRDVEREIVPMLESESLGLLVWSPLAGGFLSGKRTRDSAVANGTRRDAMPFPPVDEERAYDIVEALHPMASARRTSTAQLAIAWLLHQPRVTSVILGARKIEQLDVTLGAVSISFSPEELAELNRVSALPIEYPGWMLDIWGKGRRDQVAAQRFAPTT